MEQCSVVIRFPDAVTVASVASVATFKFNVEKSLNQASQITVENKSGVGAIPAWYDKTNKKLYTATATGHYWAVDGAKMTYT